MKVGLEERLRQQRDAGHKLLVPYVTGGIVAGWTDILEAMVASGADAVEVGIPFSDPAMDGPTIQEASSRALERGTTPASILNDLRRVAADLDAPLVAMAYCNIVFRMGARRFAAEAVDAGITGAILPDVPMEEMGSWAPAAEAAGLETVLLAGPITPDDRLARVCERSRGFVYGVNLMGVTGERTALGEQSAVLAKRMKAITDRPVIMGFGVTTPEQAAVVAEPADGVIVASALMRRVLDGASPEQVGESVSALRAALDSSVAAKQPPRSTSGTKPISLR